jgi:hypothetical protein
MKLRELIEKLGEYDPELVVTLDGAEGGITEEIHLREVLALVHHNCDEWVGEHEPVDGLIFEDDESERRKFLLITAYEEDLQPAWEEDLGPMWDPTCGPTWFAPWGNPSDN